MTQGSILICFGFRGAKRRIARRAGVCVISRWNEVAQPLSRRVASLPFSNFFHVQTNYAWARDASLQTSDYRKNYSTAAKKTSMTKPWTLPDPHNVIDLLPLSEREKLTSNLCYPKLGAHQLVSPRPGCMLACHKPKGVQIARMSSWTHTHTHHVAQCTRRLRGWATSLPINKLNFIQF